MGALPSDTPWRQNVTVLLLKAFAIIFLRDPYENQPHAKPRFLLLDRKTAYLSQQFLGWVWCPCILSATPRPDARQSDLGFGLWRNPKASILSQLLNDW
jgi:hypothetical protein